MEKFCALLIVAISSVGLASENLISASMCGDIAENATLAYVMPDAGTAKAMTYTAEFDFEKILYRESERLGRKALEDHTEMTYALGEAYRKEAYKFCLSMMSK